MNDYNDSVDGITSKAVTWKIRFVLLINMVLIHNYDKNSYQFVFFQEKEKLVENVCYKNSNAISECQWPYYNVVWILSRLVS